MTVVGVTKMPAIDTTDKIFEILGVKGVFEVKEPHAVPYTLVRQGLPTASVKQVAKYYGIPESRVATLVGTSGRTIERLRKAHKPLNSTWSDRLYRLARIGARAVEVFESEETARKWLNRPNRALGGEVPLNLLDTDAGAEQVDELLTRIEYGVYS